MNDNGYNNGYNNNFNSGNPYNGNNQNNAPQERRGLAIAALITGILSLPLAFCTGYIGCFMGLAALLLGIFSKGAAPQRSVMGILGIIFGIIAMVAGIAITILAVYMVMNNPEFMQQYKDLMEYYNNSIS